MAVATTSSQTYHRAHIHNIYEACEYSYDDPSRYRGDRQDADPTTGSTSPVTLVSGQNMDYVDAGYLFLSEVWVIMYGMTSMPMECKMQASYRSVE